MLSESYKKRIQELANILDENRLQKLVDQKFPQDIIDFAKEFASRTSREPVTEDKINKNQYIPWISSELKRDSSIAKEKDKLSSIITWIKNSGYNKIPANAPFEQVYEKAKLWLEKNTIDVESGNKLEGGDILYKFPDGSQIIRVNNLNWCMKVGEKRGWCFSGEGTAKTFTGLDELDSQTEGYMILDKDGTAKLALQYNKSTGVVDDYQGAFNKIPEESIAIESIKLLGSLPVIKDLKGHQDTFWKTIKEHPKFSELFKGLKNLNLNLKRKWQLGIPFTEEEKKNMSMMERAKFGLLNREEIEKLEPFIKSILATSLYPSDDEGIKSSFTPEQLGFDEYYIEFTKEYVKIDITEEDYDEDYSGLDEDSLWIYNMVNGYDYYEELDSDELEYMDGYINKENINKLKDISTTLGIGKYDFSKDEAIKRFIENYFPSEIEGREFKENIFNEYLSDLGYAQAEARREAVNNYVDSEQKFKYSSGYLILPYKELYSFLISKLESGETIKSFKELEGAEINGEIQLENVYYEAGTDEEKIVDLNKNFEHSLDRLIEFLEERGTSFKSHLNKSINILKTLGFDKNNILINGNKAIIIKDINFDDEKYLIDYREYPEDSNLQTSSEMIWADKEPEKKIKGWIAFDSLANYVQSNILFEIRDIIREQIKSIF